MYGHFGISKTISCILYSYLSNIIISYLMKNPQQYKSPTLTVPKLVYWTIDTTIFVKRIILQNIVKQF